MRILVDTNVLGQWIILKSSIGDDQEFERKILEAYGKRAQSYEFMEYILREEVLERVEVFYTDIILVELMNVLVEDFVYNSMWLEGVSPIYFQRYYQRYLPNWEELEGLILDALNAVSVIEQKFTKLPCEVEAPEDYYNLMYLLGRGGLKTQDAYIVSLAMKNGVEFLVTMDSDLLNLSRKRDVYELIRNSGLEIVKPKTMFNILRKL
ncbi:PIN domain-containing protein [Thermococcus sp.]|uniref:PIN domain-containing protein n=1 Tax=Thermococcus sp. TaxID=35749 RepID=UPI00261865AE|nr:PIN domain-containing protein [Thermococcus sp.]